MALYNPLPHRPFISIPAIRRRPILSMSSTCKGKASAFCWMVQLTSCELTCVVEDGFHFIWSACEFYQLGKDRLSS